MDQGGQERDPLDAAFLPSKEEPNQLVGGLGVSGDTSCTDHITAWRLRDTLDLNSVPGGVSPTHDDNLIISTPVHPNSFEHPNCGDGGEVEIIRDLPTNYPTE